jgi:transglutaminase-like putative cysteine protease
MYTALFCAMAISQRIPCRAVSGLFFEPPFPRTYSSKGSPTDPSVYGSHVYAEFYLPSYGWIPVDASIGRGSGRPDSYFGHTHDPFLINSKGFGIRLRRCYVKEEPSHVLLDARCFVQLSVRGLLWL